jgi:NAD(P)-dependent dehydrogenase (short-subunit alcohol dehydrogenase family)
MGAQDKVAIVTGGGQGIGKAIAKRLLELKNRVVIAEIDEEAGIETQQELGALGDVQFIRTDIACEADSLQLAQQTHERFGRIDILINNAAIAKRKPLLELGLEEWNEVISVNLTGAFLCCKFCIPYLRHAKGSIINISSTRALMSEPNTEAYSASKGAVIALTHAMAMSLGPDVRVNCVSPGWIEVSDWQKKRSRQVPGLRPEDHSQHPSGRVGKPEDVAGMVSFLVSAEAGFITGQNFIIDGGMTRKMTYLD